MYSHATGFNSSGYISLLSYTTYSPEYTSNAHKRSSPGKPGGGGRSDITFILNIHFISIVFIAACRCSHGSCTIGHSILCSSLGQRQEDGHINKNTAWQPDVSEAGHSCRCLYEPGHKSKVEMLQVNAGAKGAGAAPDGDGRCWLREK